MSDNTTIGTWDRGYLEAVYTLARWRFEAMSSELVETHRYAKYADRYAGGLELVKILTSKTYEEIDRDVLHAYNNRYGKKGRGNEQDYQAHDQAHNRRGVR